MPSWNRKLNQIRLYDVSDFMQVTSQSNSTVYLFYLVVLPLYKFQDYKRYSVP